VNCAVKRLPSCQSCIAIFGIAMNVKGYLSYNGTKMKLRPVFICFLVLFQAAIAQNNSNVWVFGRGNVLNFNTTPPTASTTSWSSILPPSHYAINQEVNGSNTWCDKNGNLQFYFLNGKYYNAQGTLLPGGSMTNYIHSAFGSGGIRLPIKSSYFCKSFRSDTIFHVYEYNQGYNNTFIDAAGRFVRVNAIVSNGNNYSVTTIGDWTGNNGGGTFDNLYLLADPISQENYLFISEHIQGTRPDVKMLRVSTLGNGLREINNTWLYQQFNTALDFKIPNRNLIHYSPLFNKLYVAKRHGTSTNFRRSRYIHSYSYGGFGNFIEDTIAFPIVSPYTKDFDTTMTIGCGFFSSDGKYLFLKADTSFYPNDWAHIFRYDLTSRDSVDFVSSATVIPLDTAVKHIELNDLQLGPDGNLYFTYGGQGPHWNDAGKRYVGRIVNPTSSDTSQMYSELKFVTYSPYSAFHSFPAFSTDQSMPPPFTLLSDCSDSVSFNFSYKNIPDSVWWNFGDTTLGSLNHSIDKEPVVHYPSYGKRYVTVQIWLRGDLINEIGDTIDVQPSPHVTLLNDTLLCSGESVLLDARQGFHADYLWSTGSSDSTLTVSESGTYWVEVQNFCGIARDTFNLGVIDPPMPTLRDTILCDEWIYVMRVYADSADYLWSTGDTSPALVPKSSSNYWVKISNPCGEIVDEADIEVRRCMCNVWIPSAFTPNGDGVNETFEIKVECRDFDFTLDIFNRWGEHIYQQTDLDRPWDGRYKGKALPNGVYTYRIQYWGRDEHGLRWKEESGTINLLQ
jgi:gliding motility-associated-like protein